MRKNKSILVAVMMIVVIMACTACEGSSDYVIKGVVHQKIFEDESTNLQIKDGEVDGEITTHPAQYIIVIEYDGGLAEVEVTQQEFDSVDEGDRVEYNATFHELKK